MRQAWLAGAAVSAFARRRLWRRRRRHPERARHRGRRHEAADQAITVNWGAEPPSLDPGLATDTTSSNVLEHHGSAREARRQPQAVPNRGGELGRQRGRDERHAPPARRRQVDERRPGDGERLRLLVEADDLARARRRLRVPVLRDQGRGGVQLLRPEEGRLQGARGQGRRHGARRLHARGQADVPAAVVHPAGAHHSFLAVNKKAVEQFGEKWTEPENIVTDGPFKLARWKHDADSTSRSGTAGATRRTSR